MNDGVWKEMRDEEGGQKENGQEKIAKDIWRVQLPALFTLLEKAADFVGVHQQRRWRHKDALCNR